MHPTVGTCLIFVFCYCCV